MIAETSREAYQSLTKLGDKQRAVYYALKELGEASNRDLANYLNKPANEITGRVFELRRLGYVQESGKKLDVQTNRRVTAWTATDPYAQTKINHVDEHKAVSWLND